MSLLCQRDSYLKSVSSKILNCELVKYKEKDLYKIVLEETIFFAEGGGQPSDYGTLNGVKIEFIERVKESVFHYCTDSFDIGSTVECVIDWNRRFDHMQQHTAQHLLSSVLEKKYGFKTISWELGSEVTNVELNTPGPISSEIRKSVQAEINQYIREAVSVNVKCVSLIEANQLTGRVGSRGMPEDVIEPIRIIEIMGIDMNMCCGTHVKNLSELQGIYLLHETAIRSGIRLYFIAGNRIFNTLHNCLTRESKITSLLGNGADLHYQVIQNIKNTNKLLENESKYMAKELAQLDAIQLEHKMATQSLTCHHRECSNTLYITRLFTLLADYFKNNPNKMLLVTCGESKGSGAFSAIGPIEMVESIKDSVLSILDGKGSIIKGRFQGKASKIENYKRLFTELEKKQIL